ncbi:DUF4276 family protein [Mucilaginibacter mali]|uniref:DUF4276 family protein n=1 Tax=Mucilaginibacter mali TaxID=2740462 RepID=A0A7D4QDD6_9SPHI|nr:DUF4276 family protein [Mucilaginibacter mali]QKJ31564.1 DUF4276 family protein [Mucilaginibacter mali]
MIRAIYFIAEGATEVEFIENCLRRYFADRGIYDIRGFDMGGSNSYDRYKYDVITFLNKEHDIIVTSLIDYYRLPNNFPGYSESHRLNGNEQKVAFIEEQISENINNSRFVPYIQLHEFEALLFTDIKGFSDIPGCDKKIVAELKSIIDQYPNPELINDGANTAPSKRLKIIEGYKKPLYGAYIALDNGLESIINKCPRFKAWLDKLEAKVASQGY